MVARIQNSCQIISNEYLCMQLFDTIIFDAHLIYVGRLLRLKFTRVLIFKKQKLHIRLYLFYAHGAENGTCAV